MSTVDDMCATLAGVATRTSAASKRTGRPRGSPPNRQAILDAARAEFSKRGYDGATIRRIAAAAGVDAALVHHYFGSKSELLIVAMRPDEALTTAELKRGGQRGVGERFLRATLHAYEMDNSRGLRTLIGLVRSAATHEEAARVMREASAHGGIAQLLEALDVSHLELRAALVTAQLVGLIMARYVLRLEPIASADVESVIAWYAPVLQRCIVGQLPGDERG